MKGKKAQVTYNKVSNAKGYEIQYSTDKKFKKGVKVKKANAKTTKVTLTKLTKGKNIMCVSEHIVWTRMTTE